MDKMIYLAMSGAKENAMRQQINSHNLANLNTTGFKADLDSLKSLPVYGPGHPSRVYTQDQSTSADFSQGAVIYTGNELDVAINGQGFIAVQDVDGSEAYTRRGDFRVNPNGLLETGDGDPVMGNGGPIAIPPFAKLEVGADGTISIQPLGEGANAIAVIDRIKLVNPDLASLKKSESGLFHSEQGEAEADALVTLMNGSLEQSNVNSVEALVTMIDISRQYEMQIKMMKEAEKKDESAAKLLKAT